METRSVVVVSLLAAAFALGIAQDAAADDRRTLKMDAVELLAGRDTPGKESITAQRDGHTYWFATPENRAAFERAPEKYEIQFGGACARMGPLSGACGCDIFAIYDGRLSVFASTQCRDGFLKAPQKLLETDDDPPAPTGDAAARGRDLLELAVKFAGGAEKIDGLLTYRQRIEVASEHEGKPARETSTFIVAFPDRFRFEDTWNDSMWGHAVAGESGSFVGSDTDRGPMVASQVRAARRVANRHLLVILKARSQPGFIASALGAGKVGETPVERVAVGFDGTTTTLGIDPATGQVLSISFVGRGPRSTLGLVEKTILEYKTIDGVTLPWRWSSTFDGDSKSARETTLTSFEVNPALAAELFEPAKKE